LTLNVVSVRYSIRAKSFAYFLIPKLLYILNNVVFCRFAVRKSQILKIICHLLMNFLLCLFDILHFGQFLTYRVDNILLLLSSNWKRKFGCFFAQRTWCCIYLLCFLLQSFNHLIEIKLLVSRLGWLRTFIYWFLFILENRDSILNIWLYGLILLWSWNIILRSKQKVESSIIQRRWWCCILLFYCFKLWHAIHSWLEINSQLATLSFIIFWGLEWRWLLNFLR